MDFGCNETASLTTLSSDAAGLFFRGAKCLRNLLICVGTVPPWHDTGWDLCKSVLMCVLVTVPLASCICLIAGTICVCWRCNVCASPLVLTEARWIARRRYCWKQRSFYYASHVLGCKTETSVLSVAFCQGPLYEYKATHKLYHRAYRANVHTAKGLNRLLQGGGGGARTTRRKRAQKAAATAGGSAKPAHERPKPVNAPPSNTVQEARLLEDLRSLVATPHTATGGRAGPPQASHWQNRRGQWPSC